MILGIIVTLGTSTIDTGSIGTAMSPLVRDMDMEVLTVAPMTAGLAEKCEVNIFPALRARIHFPVGDTITVTVTILMAMVIMVTVIMIMATTVIGTASCESSLG